MGVTNRTHSTRPRSRLYPDIPLPDAPVIYTGAFPILTAWPGSICNIGTTEDPSLIFFTTMHEKTKSWERLQRDFFGLLSTGISHRIHIVRTSCNQLPARSGSSNVLFNFFFFFFYWPWRLEICVPDYKFCLHNFDWFCLQKSSDEKCGVFFFLFCPWHCDRGLIALIVHYFLIWNKKKECIIINRVIRSHMSSIYIESPYIYIYWDTLYFIVPQLLLYKDGFSIK